MYTIVKESLMQGNTLSLHYILRKIVRVLSALVTVVCVGFAAPPGCKTESKPAAPVEYSSYLGGSGFEHIRDVAVDLRGNIYVTGGTESHHFLTTGNSLQRIQISGTRQSNSIRNCDVFVSKFDPAGIHQWTTLIGGPNYDRAYAIEVDASENVFIAGRAGKDFPTTTGTVQTVFQGGQGASFYGPQDGFVAGLSSDGSKLLWSTYFGTPDPMIVRDIALDRSGNIAIASSRTHGSYPSPIASSFQNKPFGGKDAVIAVISPDGRNVLWAVYAGGAKDEAEENSIGMDKDGNLFLLTFTASPDAFTTPSAFDRTFNGGKQDYYLLKYSSNGHLLFATYLGGSGNEELETHNLIVDPAGIAFVSGMSTSPDYPTTAAAFQKSYASGSGKKDAGDIVITKVSQDGSSLLASTYLGGKHSDSTQGGGIDSFGNLYLTGISSSNDFPLTADAYQSVKKGPADAVVVKLTGALDQLLYSTYFGGNGLEGGRAAIHSPSGFLFAGQTTSSNFPVSPAAFQTVYGGNTDAFLARIEK